MQPICLLYYYYFIFFQNFTKSSFFIVGNLSDANSRRTNSTDYVFHFDVIPGNSYKLWVCIINLD